MGGSFSAVSKPNFATHPHSISQDFGISSIYFIFAFVFKFVVFRTVSDNTLSEISRFFVDLIDFASCTMFYQHVVFSNMLYVHTFHTFSYPYSDEILVSRPGSGK